MKIFVLYSTPNGDCKQAIVTPVGDDIDIANEEGARNDIVALLPDVNEDAPIYMIDCEDDDVQRIMVVEHGSGEEVPATFHDLDGVVDEDEDGDDSDED